MYCTQAGFNPVPARGIRTTHTVAVRMPRAGMGIECGLRHWRMMKIVEITFVTQKLQHRTFPVAPQICDSRPRFSPNLSFVGHEVLSTHTFVVALGDHRFGWSQEGEEESQILPIHRSKSSFFSSKIFLFLGIFLPQSPLPPSSEVTALPIRRPSVPCFFFIRNEDMISSSSLRTS